MGYNHLRIRPVLVEPGGTQVLPPSGRLKERIRRWKSNWKPPSRSDSGAIFWAIWCHVCVILVLCLVFQQCWKLQNLEQHQQIQLCPLIRFLSISISFILFPPSIYPISTLSPEKTVTFIATECINMFLVPVSWCKISIPGACESGLRLLEIWGHHHNDGQWPKLPFAKVT